MQELETNNKDNRNLYEYIKQQYTTYKPTVKIGKKDWELHFKNLYKNSEETEDEDEDIIVDRNSDEDAPEEFVKQSIEIKQNSTTR